MTDKAIEVYVIWCLLNGMAISVSLIVGIPIFIGWKLYTEWKASNERDIV